MKPGTATFIRTLILTIAIGITLCYAYLFSTILDFFPWGNSHAYLIWEPLVLYYLFPAILGLAILNFIIPENGKLVRKIGLVLLSTGFLLPSLLGFDLPSQSPGRLSGVLVAGIGVVFLFFYILSQIPSFHKKDEN